MGGRPWHWAWGPAALLVVAACTLESSPRSVQPITVASTQPEPEARDVSCRGSVSFFFDLPLHPGSIGTNAIVVVSGELSHPGYISYDPGARALTFRPSRRYRRNLRYRALLGEGLRGLRYGEAVTGYSLAFWVGEECEASELPRAAMLSTELAGLFADRCGSAGCHGPPTPAAGLDLSQPALAAASAVGQPSWQWWGWARIEPGSAAWSYLVYKIIGEETVLGDSMPPSRLLEPENQAQVIQWIEGGAKVDLAPVAP